MECLILIINNKEDNNNCNGIIIFLFRTTILMSLLKSSNRCIISVFLERNAFEMARCNGASPGTDLHQLNDSFGTNEIQIEFFNFIIDDNDNFQCKLHSHKKGELGIDFAK